MAVDSREANILLSSEIMTEDLEVSDSDECSSADEDDSYSKNLVKCRLKKMVMGQSQNDAVSNSDSADSVDYHKMSVVEKREYQTELLELAKKVNIIICLPTGTGKTYIALKLTEYILPDAIEKKKKIIFLANNVPLVHQQAKYFSANLINTSLKDDQYVRAITGDLNVDVWEEKQWIEILNKYHILVMSTQILLDVMVKAYIKWDQIALLILDECHHAQKNHPMALLMKRYGERKAQGGIELPKVLGLTATIIKGASREELIPQDIADIEQLLCCKAVTHRNYEEVLKHSTDSMLRTNLYSVNYGVTDSTCYEMTAFIEFLGELPRVLGTDEELSLIERINHPLLVTEEQIFTRDKGIPRTLKSFLNDLLKTYEELGPYCCKIAAIYKLVLLTQWIQQLDAVAGGGAWDLGVDDEMPEIEMGISALLYHAQTVVLQFMKKLDLQMEEAVPASCTSKKQKDAFKIRNCISGKLDKLWGILTDRRISHEDKRDELCGLIFCQRRVTAVVLRWYLQFAAQHWPEDLGFLRPELIVGHSTIVQNTDTARFTSKRQTEIIRRFHDKELNLLVATQVVEEGLNVPSCNLMIRFDQIQTYPSFVQSMGRARKKGAICYALISENEQMSEEGKIRSYQVYNMKLSEALRKNAMHVGEGSEVDATVIDDPIPPFCPSGDPDGPKITSTDAIALVHQYCSQLSCDKIGALLPTSFWSDKIGDDKKPCFMAIVLLPILSPVRDPVEGKWMPDKTLAKRSAFLEVAKKLYEADELTENLVPKPRSISSYKCDFLDNLAEMYEQEKLKANGKIGTRKRVQQYKKATPKIMAESHVLPNSPVSVYKIEISLNPDYARDAESRRLFEFERFSLSFGIITSANLDDIPTFQLMANYGSYSVSLKHCHISNSPTVTLTESQVAGLEKFQVFMRDSVFKIRHPVLAPDAQRPIFMAPLRKTPCGLEEIDWDLVRALPVENNERLLKKPDEDERMHFQFIEALYNNSIIVPWYKEDNEPELLCTVNILNGSCSLSEFEEPRKFPTFHDYYTKKYGVKIHHPDLPLVHCKSIGDQLNFLTVKVDGKARRRDIQRSMLKIIPELTNMHSLPASLYIQGRLLPSVMHRISRLLLANELRQSVANHFQWKVDVPLEERCKGSGTAGVRSQLQPTEQCLEESVKQINLKDSSPEESPKKKTPFFLIEETNPFELSLELIARVDAVSPFRNGRGKFREQKYALPEPPVYKSNMGYELMDIDQIPTPGFDKLTDFKVERGPSMETIMEALTLSNAQDSISLEKLEVMGDSVLKFVVSLHIFRSFPQWDEGKMTLLRMKLISNLHLYQIGKSHRIGELLSGSIFIPNENWLPSGFTVPKHIEDWVFSRSLDYEIFKPNSTTTLASLPSEEDLDKELQNINLNAFKSVCPHTNYTYSKLGDKNVSDAVESIIGAYYMNGGLDGSFRVMEWLGLRGPLEDGSAVVYSRESCLVPPLNNTHYEKKGNPRKHIPYLKNLEEILKYEFKDPLIAVEALTHPTFMGNRSTPCYERLEYVGDAILDFLVTDYILQNTGITDPGKITDLRAALVNNVTFGCLAVRYGFHTFLKYDSELLANCIGQFAQHQEDIDHVVSDPYKLLSDFDCPTVREIEVPKVLGDIFESIAGAVFVDSGMSIDTVWRVFYRLMKHEFDIFSKNIPKNPLRKLYEQYPRGVKFRKITSDSQKKDSKDKKPCAAKFQAVFLKLPGFDKYILGVGNTVKQAKQAAAKFAIRSKQSKS